MGLDLELLIANKSPIGATGYSVASLKLNRVPQLFREIADLPSTVLDPCEFNCHHAEPKDPDEEECYGQVEVDAYGVPLMWVRAGDLAACLAAHHAYAAITHAPTLAAARYVAALPDHWPVVLYWY